MRLLWDGTVAVEDAVLAPLTQSVDLTARRLLIVRLGISIKRGNFLLGKTSNFGTYSVKLRYVLPLMSLKRFLGDGLVIYSRALGASNLAGLYKPECSLRNLDV